MCVCVCVCVCVYIHYSSVGSINECFLCLWKEAKFLEVHAGAYATFWISMCMRERAHACQGERIDVNFVCMKCAIILQKCSLLLRMRAFCKTAIERHQHFCSRETASAFPCARTNAQRAYTYTNTYSGCKSRTFAPCWAAEILQNLEIQ